MCTNAMPGFNCTCSAGYTGSGDICQDINECVSILETCGPNSQCSNFDGAFTCSCLSGYEGMFFFPFFLQDTDHHDANTSRNTYCQSTNIRRVFIFGYFRPGLVWRKICCGRNFVSYGSVRQEDMQAAAVQAEHLMRPKWVLALGGRDKNGTKICTLTVEGNNMTTVCAGNLTVL